MPSEHDPGPCRAKKGLLFLQDCGEPAIARCERCSRPICGMHQVLTRTIVCCPECAAGVEQAEPAAGPAAGQPASQPPGQPANSAVDAVRRRQAYYNDYGYHPYYYGHHVYYSDHDYHVFDEKTHVHHGPVAADDLAGGSAVGDAADTGGGAAFGSADDSDTGGDSDAGGDLDDAMES